MSVRAAKCYWRLQLQALKEEITLISYSLSSQLVDGDLSCYRWSPTISGLARPTATPLVVWLDRVFLQQMVHLTTTGPQWNFHHHLSYKHLTLSMITERVVIVQVIVFEKSHLATETPYIYNGKVKRKLHCVIILSCHVKVWWLQQEDAARSIASCRDPFLCGQHF